MKIRNEFTRTAILGLSFVVCFALGIAIFLWGEQNNLVIMVVGGTIAIAAVILTSLLNKKLTPKSYDELEEAFKKRHSNDTADDLRKLTFCPTCHGSFGHWIQSKKSIVFEECPTCKGKGEIAPSKEKISSTKWLTCGNCSGSGRLYNHSKTPSQYIVCPNCSGYGRVDDLRTEEEIQAEKKELAERWKLMEQERLEQEKKDTETSNEEKVLKKLSSIETRLDNLTTKLDRSNTNDLRSVVSKISRTLETLCFFGALLFLHQCSNTDKIRDNMEDLGKKLDSIEKSIDKLEGKFEYTEY